MKFLSDFEGKVAMVTGSSAGMGADLSVELARRGARVVITGRSEQKIKNVVQRCVDAGQKRQNVLPIVADFKNDKSIENLLAQTIKTFGTVHFLVNNAGVGHFGNFENTTPEMLMEMMNINVRGTFKITQLCVPYLIENKGSVVNVSSVAGIACAPPVHAYGISKGCLLQFTKLLALELGPKGVRVNVICPSTIKDTDILTRPWGPVKRKEDLEDFLKPQIPLVPLKRLGELKDTTESIMFLLSGESTFVTGVNLRVDGGLCCTKLGPAGSKKTK